MLDQSVEAIYQNKDLKKANEILNQGLKSNGPFYSLGYFMSKKIVENGNEKELGKIIEQGTLAFFNKFIEVIQNQNKEPFFSTIFTSKLSGLYSTSE